MKNTRKFSSASIRSPSHRWYFVLHTVRHLVIALALLSAAVLTGCGMGAVSLPNEPTPMAVLSSTAISFTPTAAGVAGTSQAVTLSNTGQQTLLLTSAVLSDTKNFALSTNCGASLLAGASCTLTVQFTPQSASAFAGTLTLVNNSGGVAGTKQVVTITGTGTVAAVPQAGLAPATIDFGTSNVPGASTPQTVTLSNTGTAPLAISGDALSDSTDFNLVSTTCTALLSAGSSCMYSLLFTPQAAGSVSGTFTLTDNSGGVAGSQQTVTLTGTGAVPALPKLSFSATSFAFPPTTVKTSATPLTLTLSNVGTVTLEITAIQLADPSNFSLTNQCGGSLTAGASCTLSLGFTPQATGAIASALVLTDNSGASSSTVQQKIPLTGTGIAAPTAQASLSPSMVAFGSANVSSSTAAQVLTLSNTGQGTLTLSGVTLSDTTNFALTSSCGLSLAAGASCSLSVSFQPQKAGALAASLTVNDNSGGIATAQQTVALSGTGVAVSTPLAVVTPATVNFPDTMITTSSAAQTFTLSNAGSQPLVLGSVAVSDTQNFSLYSGCGPQVAPGANCTLSLVFHPQTVQAYRTAVLLTDNSGAMDATAAPAAQQTVAVLANGIAFAGPRAEAAPASLSFAATVTNATAAPQTATLTNTGTTALTVSNVMLKGASASAFNITANTCTGPVAAGSSCSVTVTYSPHLASTADTASLVFTDDAFNTPGSVQVVALTGTALAEIDSVENFGDSLTCGFYAQPHDGTGLVYSLEGYAGLFDSFLAVPAQNWCRQGDTAADLSRQWVPWNSTPSSTGHQLFTLMIGTNDAYRYGIPQNALQTYTQEVGAALAWLAIPNSDKVLANAVTQQNGVWSADVGFGLKTTGNGASLNFTVNQAVAGHNLYLVYHVWDLPYGQAGKATIAVDGTVQATVEESQNSLALLPTENGTMDTFLVQTVPLGAVGAHTVTFTSAGPEGSSAGLLWAGVPQADYRTLDGTPRVMVGLITNSPSGNQTFAADIYNLQLKSLVPALVADGMNLILVPTDGVLDPASDFADLLHPNNTGHAKLAATFEQYR